MSFQADILINVKGFQDLARIQKALDGTAYKIDEINAKAASMGEPVKNLTRFLTQLEQAERALSKVAIGSPQETKAVANYVTALNNANAARSRQNQLIDQEVDSRNATINAIRATVEANIAESQATRMARSEAAALNKELAARARLERNLSERGLMQLQGGGVAKGVADAGFGLQGPKPAPKGGLQAPGVMDAILGGAFPALFGGGPGAIIGGAAGGFIGGKMGGLGGMALSIGLSAVGQQLDEAIKKVKDLGDAINAVDVDKLRQSFIFVNSELEVAITRSIRLGDIENARAVAAAAAARQTGALGTAIADSANATTLLGNAWTKVSGSVATLLSMLAAPFAAALAGILNVVNLVVVGWNSVISAAGQATKIVAEFVVSLLGGEKALKFMQDLFKGLNEEQEKANAAAQLKLDLGNEDLAINKSLLELEKQRTAGVTAEQKLQNVDVALREKKLGIMRDLWKEEARIREEHKNASQERIEALVNQARADAGIKMQREQILALREKERIMLQAALDATQAIATKELNAVNTREAVRQQELTVIQSILSTTKELNAIDQERLATELKYSMSLNQTAAIIEKVAQKRIQQGEAELTLAKNNADALVAAAIAESERADIKARAAEKDMKTLENQKELTELKRVELQATIDNAAVAEAAIGTAIEVAQQTKIAAEARLEQLKYTIDLERREQQVAAYAAEYSRYTKNAVANLEQRQNTFNNENSLIQAQLNGLMTINRLEINRLNTKLQQAATEQERIGIIYQIRDAEIENARLTLLATRSQIEANVEQQRIARDIAKLKLEELYAVVKLAEAQGVLNRAYLDALQAAYNAYNIAQNNYETTVAVADVQWDVANAVYEASVNAARLKAELSASATEAGNLAGSMERAAGAMGRMRGGAYGGTEFGGAYAVSNLALQEQGRAIWDAALKRATGAGNVNPLNAQAILTEAQMRIADLQRPYLQAQKAQNYQQSVQELQQLGIPNRAATPAYAQSYMASTMASANASANPQVNINTGPVMQMDGTNYVTMTDLQQATSSAARQGANLALSQLQNDPTVRRSIGVAR